MVKQYDHTAFVDLSGEAVQDENGDFKPNTDDNRKLKFECRPVPQSANGFNFLESASGTKINYNWIVYASIHAPHLVEGTQIRIYNEQKELILTDNVKRFFKNQLHTRIWL